MNSRFSKSRRKLRAAIKSHGEEKIADALREIVNEIDGEYLRVIQQEQTVIRSAAASVGGKARGKALAKKRRKAIAAAGGVQRSKNLTAEERRAIASAAATERWRKHRAKSKTASKNTASGRR